MTKPPREHHAPEDAESLRREIEELRERLAELEHAAREAQEARREQDAVNRLIPWGLWSADSGGRDLRFGAPFLEMLGVEQADFSYDLWAARLHPDDKEQVTANWKASRRKRAFWSQEYRIRDKDGNYRSVFSRGAPVYDEDESMGGWVGVCLDMDHRKHLEQSLRRAKEQAEAASRAKTDFLVNLSHELRSPVTGILGTAEVMSRRDPTPEQREALELIRLSGNAMMGLVNDLRDISRLDKGCVELRRIDFDLEETLEEALSIYTYLAREKGLALRTSLGKGVPAWVRGDPHRLGQILRNLVGNALKYTVSGSVSVEVELVSEKGGEVELLFSVSDTGPGIAKDRVANLYQSLKQKSSPDRLGGAGVGLTLVGRLVDLMEGDVSVSSREGKGSSFYFNLPLLRGEKPEAGGEQPELAAQSNAWRSNQPGPRVLVVEDNRVNQRFLLTLLEDEGYRVKLAENGQEALDVLDSGETFDVVLMDVQMPGMDGLEATRRIRQERRAWYSDIPIIGLSAYAMKGDRERFLGEGMDEYLPKPVNIDDLWESLRLYARAPEGEDPDRDAQVIDHAYLRETYRGKEDLLRRLVGEFANETVRMRHALSEAREKGGIEEAARLAHGIGSQAGTLGLPRLRSRALEAERTIKESDRDEADRAVARLEEAVSEGLDALRRETGVSN